MNYATQADIEARYGAERVLLLADRDGDGAADADVIVQALDDAAATTDSYLHERYKLPLAGAVPTVLVRINVDLAVYYMASNENLMSDLVGERKKDAIKQLDAIAQGKIKLDIPAAPPVVGGGAKLEAARRVFKRAGGRIL